MTTRGIGATTTTRWRRGEKNCSATPRSTERSTRAAPTTIRSRSGSPRARRPRTTSTSTRRSCYAETGTTETGTKARKTAAGFGPLRTVFSTRRTRRRRGRRGGTALATTRSGTSNGLRTDFERSRTTPPRRSARPRREAAVRSGSTGRTRNPPGTASTGRSAARIPWRRRRFSRRRTSRGQTASAHPTAPRRSGPGSGVTGGCLRLRTRTRARTAEASGGRRRPS